MTKTLYIGYYMPGTDEYIVVVTFDLDEALTQTEDSRWDLSPFVRHYSRHLVLGFSVEVDAFDTPRQAFEKLLSTSLENWEEVFYREITLPGVEYKTEQPAE